MARGHDAARALPARRAGRPGRDGARGRGPLPVPRPPGLRATPRALPAEAQARRPARQDRAARARRASCCRRRSPSRGQAALPGARGRRRSSPRTPRPGSRSALARRRSARPGSGTRSASRACVRRCRGRPGDRAARGHGPGRRALDPALARAFSGVRPRRLPARDGRAAGQNRSHRRTVDAARRSHDRRTQTDVRKRDARLHRGELPLHAPRPRARRRRRPARRSGSSTRSASSSSSRRSSRRYGIAVEDVEITEENFGSIDAIAGVRRAQAGRGLSARTLGEDLRAAAAARPATRPAVIAGERRAHLRASSTAPPTGVAAGLRERGVERGDRVAVVLPNGARGGRRDLRRPARRRGVLAAQPDGQGATSSPTCSSDSGARGADLRRRARRDGTRGGRAAAGEVHGDQRRRAARRRTSAAPAQAARRSTSPRSSTPRARPASRRA